MWALLNAGTDVLPTQSIASDANFLAGYYLNCENKLLVGAPACSKNLCSMCLQYTDKNVQQTKFCPQKQRCLWLNKDKNTTILKCFASSYIFKYVFPF